MFNHSRGGYKANIKQPPRRGQPPKRGQKCRSQSVLSSEVLLYLDMSESNKRLLKGLSIAALPVSIALSPITAPVLAVTLAEYTRKDLKDKEGDLTED